MSSKNNSPDENDFYVGYLPSTPAATKTRVRIAVLFFAASSFLTAFLIASSQQPADQGIFDFGALDSFEGTLETQPYPTLVAQGQRHLLVAQGKHGAKALLKESEIQEGSQLRVSGAAIHAPTGSMIEVVSAEVGTTDKIAQSLVVSLGQQKLIGEIVDSKCYLGVMKPGRGKPHRACAALCIEGGIPPALLIRTDEAQQILLLTGPEGEAPGPEILEFVAEPVEIEGTVSAHGKQLYLSAAIADIRRLTH